MEMLFSADMTRLGSGFVGTEIFGFFLGVAWLFALFFIQKRQLIICLIVELSEVGALLPFLMGIEWLCSPKILAILT